ncbi:high mobility group nucleosome-binding domain-containing protein 3 isoform X2 [Periophthalmus magnuspinnatus]|uniref:high mobility group nucleosome-binding domain-containing protein 3 isoform X2 n=1 Tax=Periophthalmus magnuspinnatus TaxID=409849 RepID=UPI00243643FD|nr:high mobility group nucleosome-binding domain-containing protein 3 isoform X2 [Periophthalmus magnuspinnatus]
MPKRKLELKSKEDSTDPSVPVSLSLSLVDHPFPPQPTRRSERLSAKPAPPKPEVKPKKAVVKKVADEKVSKVAKKGGARGKKEDGSAHNGDTKNNEIYVSRPCVRVSSIRTTAPSLMSVRGQSETVRVKGI